MEQGIIISGGHTWDSHLLLFQTLYSISSEKNHTIVFPLPIDVIGSLMGPAAKSPSETEKKSVWSCSYVVLSFIISSVWSLSASLAYAVETPNFLVNIIKISKKNNKDFS